MAVGSNDQDENSSSTAKTLKILQKLERPGKRFVGSKGWWLTCRLRSAIAILYGNLI
ncbi:conserved hypothetical protein [Ricinus communis]|uniref:Uncharacterized protein n=1 Tax=Ricinus communis TaxID=3988 RepID=B9T5W4_RICCO|nr:conserved hypothetical protein [Ricinus communis]